MISVHQADDGLRRPFTPAARLTIEQAVGHKVVPCHSNGDRTSCYWISPRSLELLADTDGEWMDMWVLLWRSMRQLDRLLTVRDEWSKK